MDVCETNLGTRKPNTRSPKPLQPLSLKSKPPLQCGLVLARWEAKKPQTSIVNCLEPLNFKPHQQQQQPP